MPMLRRTTFRLRCWTRFFAAPEAVWALKTDPALLADEFRPLFHLLSRDASGLAQAFARAEPGRADAWLVPPGLPWPLELVVVEPPHRYVDRSENLLFPDWEHEHLVEPTTDGCRYVDSVTFTPTLPAAKLSAIAVQRLFQHRHLRAARHLPTDRRATGVAVLRVVAREGERPSEAA